MADEDSTRTKPNPEDTFVIEYWGSFKNGVLVDEMNHTVELPAGVFLRPLPVGFSGEGAPSMRRTWKVFGVPSCEADGKRGESVQPP